MGIDARGNKSGLAVLAAGVTLCAFAAAAQVPFFEGGRTAWKVCLASRTDPATVYAAQERLLAVQKKKGALVDRARAETLVFRLARQERDVWVTWPGRVAALMAAQIMAEVERQSGASVTIETAIMQRVLEAHVREQLDALADLRVSLA